MLTQAPYLPERWTSRSFLVETYQTRCSAAALGRSSTWMLGPGAPKLADLGRRNAYVDVFADVGGLSTSLGCIVTSEVKLVVLLCASSSSASARLSSGSRIARSIATGSPRCLPRSITAQSTSLEARCQAPLNE
jgi:hypothetical protein